MTEDFRYGLQKSLGDAGGTEYQQVQDYPGQQHAAERRTYLPILRVGEPAIARDRTDVSNNWNLLNIYQSSKDGIVKISGQRPVLDRNGRPAVETGTGSGFFVTEDGRIATDYHVVQGMQSLQVKTADGRVFNARIENVERDIDKKNDLAIIKIDAKPFERFKALPLGDPKFNVGDNVVAIGYPRGWEDMFASPGVANKNQALNKVVNETSLGEGEDGNRIVIDSTIHVEPGNSGGPLLSKDGKVIGVIATTDARPDRDDDRMSTPGRSAEPTPVQELIALLNRTRQIVRTNPIQTAGTLPLDQIQPYYQTAPTAVPSGDLQTSWQRTPLRRGLIGLSGYEAGAISQPSTILPGVYQFSPLLDNLGPGAVRPGSPPIRRSFIGRFPTWQNKSSSSDSIDAQSMQTSPTPARIDVPALADQPGIPSIPLAPNLDLSREQPPRLMHTVSHGFNLYNQFNMLRAGRTGPVGSVFSAALGTYDLAFDDFGKFRNALSNGTSSDVLWSGVKLGADALLIGGGIAGFSSRYRIIGGIAAIGGSAIKLCSDGSSYLRHFR